MSVCVPSALNLHLIRRHQHPPTHISFSPSSPLLLLPTLPLSGSGRPLPSPAFFASCPLWAPQTLPGHSPAHCASSAISSWSSLFSRWLDIGCLCWGLTEAEVCSQVSPTPPCRNLQVQLTFEKPPLLQPHGTLRAGETPWGQGRALPTEQRVAIAPSAGRHEGSPLW